MDRGRASAQEPAHEEPAALALARGQFATVAPGAAVLERSPAGLLALQRSAGNRAVNRMLARKTDEERPMADPDSGEQGFTDERRVEPSTGTAFVWDYFDRTLMIVPAERGPDADKTPLQLVLKDAATLQVERYEKLTPVRVAALEWLRVVQGTYQETVAQKKIRTDDGKKKSGLTLCNAHLGKYAGELNKLVTDESKKTQGWDKMDPRAATMKGSPERIGAFHTLDQDYTRRPKPGDIVSYGEVLTPKDKAGNPIKGAKRTANFQTVMHIGVFKSYRAGTDGAEIWTVVDGGQGTFASRQETRERTRNFKLEDLEVAIPGAWNVGKPVTENLKCGVFSSKINDAGQSGDKLLRGWLDIDEYFGVAPAATDGGYNKYFDGLKKGAKK